MKFIHTGDLHCGMKPDSDKPWSKERAQALYEGLKRVVEKASEEEVQLLLIAGDLFHHQPLMRELKEVCYLFASIPQIQIAIIAGNHDRLRDSSAVLSYPWPKNVFFFRETELTGIYFEKLNTEVYGFSYNSREITENRLAGVRVPDNSRINILLAHGGDAKHLPLDLNELENAGFSYCALGHIHKPQVLMNGKGAFPGSPEPLDMTETGQHGVYLGEINDVTHTLSSLQFLPIASVQYVPLVIQVTPDSTNTELLTRIGEEITRRGVKNIYRLRIRGMRDPEIEFDLDVLKDRFRISELIDESEPDYDFSRLFAQHPSDMLGFYIRELVKEEMTPQEKKALFYGVNALLRTTDERSGKE